MFNMKRQSDIGYKLVIIYNRKQDEYHVTGYTAYREDSHNSNIRYSQDGATLHFKTMQEAMDSITNYPDQPDKK